MKIRFECDKDINMKYWIVPSNNNKFRLSDFLANHGYVDWKQKNKFSVGDIVFMYCTKPESRIRFIMKVEKTLSKYFLQQIFRTAPEVGTKSIGKQQRNTMRQLFFLGRLRKCLFKTDRSQLMFDTAPVNGTFSTPVVIG